MILRKLTLALSAVALSFSVTTFAQQAAPQPEQQTPTNPAGEVIGKLATMGHMQFGDFPVTQTELDRASEFVQARAAQTGKTITRDQSLVALGYIAGCSCSSAGSPGSSCRSSARTSGQQPASSGSSSGSADRNHS